MAKKSAETDRRARVEQLRKAQADVERRRTLLIVGAALSVIVVLGVIVTKVVLDQVALQDINRIGVTAAAASCDAPTTDAAPTSGTTVHVGPGTTKPDVTTVTYSTVPPSNGEHYATPVYPSLPFYTAADRPQLEQLVHNLEHGYTILWYSPDLPKAQVDQLERLSTLARKNTATGGGKFIASAWDTARGAFPAGRTIALSHWSAKVGHRQFCGSLSGAAVSTFIEQYPYSDSPEPNAQ